MSTDDIYIDATTIDWEYSSPLPLMNLGKETALSRLQRQLVARGYNPIVISDDIDVISISKSSVYATDIEPGDKVIKANWVFTKLGLDNFLESNPYDEQYFVINNSKEYWYFIKTVVNAGKLDDLNKASI